MLLENMNMAFMAIKANKMRSFLTMLGIIIGIGSVISIVSIGDSMRAMFVDLYKNVGETRAIVRTDWQVANYRQSDSFTLDEMERVREIFGDQLAYLSNGMAETVEAAYKTKKDKIDLTGIDSNYTDVQTVNMLYGRMIDEQDVRDRRRHVVLEAQAAETLYGVENAVGKTFRATLYNNVEDFTVVGIYKKETSPLQAMFMGGRQNDEGFMAYTVFTNPNDYFGTLDLYGKPDTDMDLLAQQLRTYIAKLHGREVEDIEFYAVAKEMGSTDNTMNGLSAAVGGIAAISLLVGGIGIMNIMLVSVTERTREIGIRKALGATTGDVLTQFLTESAILSACGGIIGVLLGVGIVSIGGAILQVHVVIRPIVVILAVSFSAIVGVFFGLYPASKAANKDPIDALRYE